MKTKGIDVSGWNGTIDWAKVKADGVQFAIIKMGNIYQSSGTVDLESTFRSNVRECERLGIHYGVYIYTYVSTVSRMQTVSGYIVDILKDACHNPAMGVYLDIEEWAVVAGGKANTVAMAQALANKIEAAGYSFGVYASTSWWESYLTDGWYDTKLRWVADWSSHCSYGKRVDIWQYSETGSVKGCSGRVDMDLGYYSPSTKPALIDKEQTYTVRSGDTWESVGKLYGVSGVHLLEYNNYLTANARLARKKIAQKTIRIPAKWIPGDVDGDGKVTAKEARLILRVSAKLAKLFRGEYMRADTDGDGKITANDARDALKRSGKR